ncbi:VOC family protein [Cellulomonas sp. KH9]|uniref:VOC family protein n=1 Tax=Cellulomonas sp. KH9 TaxID=1855324 RepID=UPI0008E2B290|nr:VOC family protein [Cellulomonas sp. KH9]SFK52621.1 4a-hydroxytetrahydrobiopterin dehydratase [Cellulomonas sp. KH9]
MSDVLPHSTVTAAVDARHWRVLLETLRATFRTPDWATGAELVARVARAADAADHHPDVLLRYGQVTVTTSSHDVHGLTQRDVDLAAAVTAIADELGLEAAVPAGEVLEIAVDALDIPAVRPFWKAVLGYDDVPGDPDALADPAGTGPAVWFQQMDAPRPQRNRIHVDVTVPHDVAEERVAAAVAAGGRLVSDAAAPAFWVLADPEGNEACVCTWQARPTA